MLEHIGPSMEHLIGEQLVTLHRFRELLERIDHRGCDTLLGAADFLCPLLLSELVLLVMRLLQLLASIFKLTLLGRKPLLPLLFEKRLVLLRKRLDRERPDLLVGEPS